MRSVFIEGGEAGYAIFDVELGKEHPLHELVEFRIRVLPVDLDDIVGALPVRTSLVWRGRPWEGVRVSELVGDVNERVPNRVHVGTMRIAAERGGGP